MGSRCQPPRRPTSPAECWREPHSLVRRWKAGCTDRNAYMCDIGAILKDTGTSSEYFLFNTNAHGASRMKHTPRFSQDIADKSFLEVDAICHDQFGHFNKLSSRFSDGMEAEVHATRGAPRSSTGAILANLSSFFHPTMMKRSNFRNPQRLRSYIYVYS